VHRGAAAVINGTERTILDKYSDYFWFALLFLSGLGSAAAWLRRYVNRDEGDGNISFRNRILAALSDVSDADCEQGVLSVQREVDEIIRESLTSYDEGAIGQEDLAAFGLVVELFNHAVAEKRATLQSGLIDQARVTSPSLLALR
jgi:hypothetical protein